MQDTSRRLSRGGVCMQRLVQHVVSLLEALGVLRQRQMVQLSQAGRQLVDRSHSGVRWRRSRLVVLTRRWSGRRSGHRVWSLPGDVSLAGSVAATESSAAAG